MRHLLSIEDLDRAGDRAHPGPREDVHRGLRARDQEGARAARPARPEPLLRSVHAHAQLLRAGRQVALAPTSSTSSRSGSSVEKGESLKDTVQTLSRLPARPDRHPLAARRRRRAGRRLDDGGRGQRRRRQARAPDAGAAGRLHAARAARQPRRPEHLDRRRRPAQPRRALEHPRLHQDGREGHRVRPADADPARDGGARATSPTRSTTSPRPTSSTRCGCRTSA